MAKRIKKVFSSPDQVIHLWANQSQDEARSSNVFFEGKSVYSYGRHYELGRLVEYNGHQVALINVDGYSVTTSGHIRSAFSATSHLITIGVEFSDVEFNTPKSFIESGLNLELSKITKDLADHFTSRSFGTSTEWSLWASNYSLGRSVDKHNDLCLALGFKNMALKLTPEFIQDHDDHVKACVAKRVARDEFDKSDEGKQAKIQAQLKRQALEIKKRGAELDAWRDGGPRTSFVASQVYKMLRINGPTVETSGGAEVPLVEARRLVYAILKGEVKPGFKVGSFTYDRMDNDLEPVVVVGCHRILLSEAKSVLFGQKSHLTLVSEEAV